MTRTSPGSGTDIELWVAAMETSVERAVAQLAVAVARPLGERGRGRAAAREEPGDDDRHQHGGDRRGQQPAAARRPSRSPSGSGAGSSGGGL